LSRRDQDLPTNTDDQRLTDRNIQLLKPEMLAKYPVVQVAPVQTSPRRGEGVAEERQGGTQVGTLPDELTDWEAAVTDDSEYQEVRKAVKDGQQSIPKHLQLKVSIRECSVSKEGHLRFRERR
jgi:hypothetical protein